MHRIVLVATIFFLLTAPAFAEWNQWRGPSRTGEAVGDDWPADFSQLTPLWEVPLGKGYAGPLVTGDRVFVVESVDKKNAAVKALRRSDGTELWRHDWQSHGSVPFFAAANGDWVRSTPVWDGETLFVGGMNEKLFALNGDNGTTRWTIDFPDHYGTKVPDFGFASSPLVDGDALYVQAANSMLRINKATGEIVWRALENSGQIQVSGAFSSPVIAELDGVRQLILLTRLALHGLDLETGDELWTQEVPNFRGMNIMTPVISGNRIFTSPYRHGAFMYDVHRKEGGWEVTELWQQKASGYMSTPVWIGDSIYMHLGNGRFASIDATSGEELWRTESFGKYWSIAFHGDRILALDSDGELLLVKATPESFTLLDRKEVATTESWAYVAVSDGQLLVRDLESVKLFAWE